MAANALNPWLEKLVALVKKREPTYSKAVTNFAFVKDELGTMKLGYALVTFLGRGESARDQDLDYGNFVLSRKLIGVSDAISLLRTVFEKQTLKVADYPETSVSVSIYDLNSIPSGSHYVSNQWPVHSISQTIDGRTTKPLPQQPLSKLGLPLYPNGSEAVVDFFCLKRFYGWGNLSNNFEVVLPDFRARIRSLRLSGNRITLEAEAREISENELRAKFFCRTEDQTYTSGDVLFKEGRATFLTEKDPSFVEAHILSTIDGESIDRKSYDYRYPSMDDGIFIENNETQLADMISKGENETVEFKVTFDPKNQKEFLESVVAFANTKGGTIFIGVDDNCGIRDFREDVKSQIADLVQGNCDPVLGVSVRSAIVGGNHQIVIVEVPEGPNKPYTFNNRGIFIRRGSSDRQIKRMELDDLYTKKNNLGYM